MSTWLLDEDGRSGGGGGGSPTNITVTQSANNVRINSSTGTSGTINTATETTAGVMSPEDKSVIEFVKNIGILNGNV